MSRCTQDNRWKKCILKSLHPLLLSIKIFFLAKVFKVCFILCWSYVQVDLIYFIKRMQIQRQAWVNELCKRRVLTWYGWFFNEKSIQPNKWLVWKAENVFVDFCYYCGKCSVVGANGILITCNCSTNVFSIYFLDCKNVFSNCKPNFFQHCPLTVVNLWNKQTRSNKNKKHLAQKNSTNDILLT